MKKILSPLQAATIFLICATVSVTNSLHAQQASSDPMLRAMQQELAREKAQLVLPGMQRPYFIEYRMDDFSSYDAIANYGALTREESAHQRVVRVTVRIGDYKQDSSSSRGDGTLQLAPEDNSPVALRYALWLATDEAYKTALRTYAIKQAALRRFQSPPTADDFSPARPVTVIDPLVSLELDRAAWKHRIVEASGLYATDPSVRADASNVQFSSATVRGVAVNRYLVNTEGTVVRHGYTGYSATVSVGGQAPDGMQLGRANGSTAVLAKDLESTAAFHARVLRDLKSYEELRKAPLVAPEDYHGPILFSGDAAADTLQHLFIPNIEADRPDAGTAARTQGVYSSSLNTPVLSSLLDVKDDPTLTSFHGERLLGAYDIDDEGVPAQPVQLVTSGKLLSYDLGREPIKDFPASNGHGRAAPGQPARSHAAVVVFSSRKASTPEQMNQKLLALALEQGRDVYAVETLGGGDELTPRLLYLVHPDGTRTLVRGADFDELDTRSIRSGILAVGNDPYVQNEIGALPQTVIAPSILFEDVEVKRANDEQQRLPYYPPPPTR